MDPGGDVFAAAGDGNGDRGLGSSPSYPAWSPGSLSYIICLYRERSCKIAMIAIFSMGWKFFPWGWNFFPWKNFHPHGKKFHPMEKNSIPMEKIAIIAILYERSHCVNVANSQGP